MVWCMVLSRPYTSRRNEAFRDHASPSRRHRLVDPVFSNAALVKRVAEICEHYERPVATWRQAREILQLDMP